MIATGAVHRRDENGKGRRCHRNTYAYSVARLTNNGQTIGAISLCNIRVISMARQLWKRTLRKQGDGVQDKLQVEALDTRHKSSWKATLMTILRRRQVHQHRRDVGHHPQSEDVDQKKRGVNHLHRRHLGVTRHLDTVDRSDQQHRHPRHQDQRHRLDRRHLHRSKHVKFVSNRENDQLGAEPRLSLVKKSRQSRRQ